MNGIATQLIVGASRYQAARTATLLSRRMEPLAVAAFGLILVCIGIAQIRRARSMQSWQETTGEILSSRVVEERAHTRADSGSGILYRPDLMYGYHIGGRELAGHRRALLDSSASMPEFAESVVRKYPPGKIVTVYFDPANPKDSVLERDNASGWASAIFGLGVAVMIGGGVWWWLTQG